MRKLALLLITVGGLLSACVAYEVPNREGRAFQGDRDREVVPNRAERDRDGDSVANREDRHMDDARRY